MVFWGYQNSYKGDGYVINMDNTKGEVADLLKMLKHNNWLDRYTRAVFIEFSILNMHSNLFSKFTRVLEYPPYGGMFSWVTVETIKLYRYTGAAGLIYLTVEMVCFLFYIAVLVKEIKFAFSLRIEYLKSIQRVAQLVVVTMTGLAFGLYIYRSILTTKTVEKMKNNEGNFSRMCTVYFLKEIIELFFSKKIRKFVI